MFSIMALEQRQWCDSDVLIIIINFEHFAMLVHLKLKLSSYRNQSIIELCCKSIYWVLHDGNFYN